MNYLLSRGGSYMDNRKYQGGYHYSRSVTVPIRTIINQGFLLCS